jgi:TldD protein
VRVPFSPYLSSNKKPFRGLVRRLARDYSYASLLATDCIGRRYEVRRDQVAVQESRWNERGCVARVHDGAGYLEVSFNRPLPYEELRRLLAGAAGSGGKAPRMDYPVHRDEALRRRWQSSVGLLPGALSVEQKLTRLTALRDRALAQSSLLADIRLVFEEVTVRKLFLSGRRELEQAYLWSQGSLIPMVRRGEDTRYVHEGFSGLKGGELLEEMEAALPQTVTLAEELLSAGRVSPGTYDVILSPEIAGLLAHEAFGHGVEADMFVKGRARAAAYLGAPVASERVTLRDGARAAEQVGSYWFDDEGTLGGDTVIVERGVMRAGISDLLSALALGTPPTGHGRRESFERKAYARMANTFFAGGPDRLEDMIASISHGYLLEKFSSGMEDPRNWGLQGIVLYGREIAGGRLTGRLVSPVIMTGYVPDVLGSVSGATPEVQLIGVGMCGKGHKEYVKNSMGGPHLKCRLRLG